MSSDLNTYNNDEEDDLDFEHAFPDVNTLASSSKAAGDRPHYMQPNFTSLLPEYANAEADQIRSAFQTNNYAALQRLPDKLAPNAVNQARLEHMDAHRGVGGDISQPPPIHVPKAVTRHGLFSQFAYAPSRYSLVDELAQVERRASEAARLTISGRDFVSGAEPRILKHEDAFGDSAYRYPHLSEPYPDLRDEERHARWLADKAIRHGAFVPSGHRLPVDGVSKLLIPEILSELKGALVADWPQGDVTLTLTEDDTIAVRFNEAGVAECEPGLIAYMNVFARSHRVPAKYKLVRVTEDWNVKPGDGGLYFVFRPPWAKHRPYQHPTGAIVQT